jgi:prepilin-type N-terminal cleavage/methylation domain-containing protein
MSTPVAHCARGFTIVELMMSLAVLAVGLTGVAAMQKVTAMSNLHAKSVAIATQITRGWQDQLIIDGSTWRRNDTTSFGKTRWLKDAVINAPWIRPSFDSDRQFGAAFDALGNPVTEANLAQAYFCVHLQLVPVVPLTDRSNATVRAAIRVLWPRAQGNPIADYCSASSTTAPDTIGNDVNNFHSIYHTVAIRVHP